MLIILILITLIIVGVYDGVSYVNGDVSALPQALLAGFIIGGIVIFAPRKSREDVAHSAVGHWRRYAALCIDIVVSMTFIMSFSILPTLIAEYFATGSWQWSYNRVAFGLPDVISITMIFGLYFNLYYYFYKHAALNRPTPGQYIMSYRIVPNGKGAPKYGERVFHGAFNLWLGIFFLYAWSKIKDGNYQWDRATNTKAVRQV